ncbi:MAG: hypothetical protein ABFE07_19415 [Armatimonadia bacterium]
MPSSPIALSVTETTAARRPDWPVSSGVPFRQGQFYKNDTLILTGPGDAPVALQWEPLAYWPDGSVHWALLDFQASPRPGGKSRYGLHIGKPTAASPGPAEPVHIARRANLITISTGPLQLTIDTSDFRLLNSLKTRNAKGDFVELLASSDGLVLRDADGETYTGWRGPVTATIERRGPIRATVALKGQYLSASGDRCFSFTVRLHAFAGSDCLKIEHTLLNDNQTGVFTNIREASLVLNLAAQPTAAALSGAGKASHTARLLQVDHDHWQAQGTKTRRGDRALGWVTADTAGVTLLAAARDFWQQWPKSLEVSDSEVKLGLFPTLADDQYEGREPREKYYYLFDGPLYKIKTGVAKRHEIWLCACAEPANADAFTTWVNAPLFAVTDPKHATATGAMGPLVPATTAVSGDYNQAEAQTFDAYQSIVEKERYYGIFNWGDWFGERVYNWGNEEYDTQHAFFLQLARTGDVRYFHWGEINARHNMDIDVVHALNDDYLDGWELKHGYSHPVHVGAVYLHAIGHTGGYFSQEEGQRLWPKAYYGGDPRNLGHLWNEGMVDYYNLTGDPWALEVALQIADNLVELSKMEGFTWWVGVDPHCGRTTGWPLKALMAAYRVSGRKQYLAAAKSIIELILADQDPHCGGWIYKLYPGHCYCRTPHWGMATFITSVMLNGMISYYEATGDERIPDSIVRAADFMINDSWDEHAGKFRYTSCPASSLTQLTLAVRSLSFAARHGNKERHKQVLVKCYRSWLEHIEEMKTEMGAFGKAYGYYHRELPHVLADLQALKLKP